MKRKVSRKMSKNNKKIKLKGKLQSYLIWPFIMLVLFAWMTIGVFLINVKAGFICLVCCLIYSLIMLLLYYRVRSEVGREMVNFALDYGQVQHSLLQELEIPYGVMDDSGRLLWSNIKLRDLCDSRINNKAIHHIFPEITGDKLPEGDEKAFIEVHYNNRIYKAELTRIFIDDFSSDNNLIDTETLNNTLIALYLFDETEIRKYIRENHEQRLVCGMIFVDNYEEALNSTEEVRRSLLAALIERKITKYMQGYDAIVHKTEKDRFQFVIQQKYLPAIQTSKFSILDEIREINIGNALPVTLCIGVGVNGINYAQNVEWCKSAIDLALGRGGDQAVIKDGEKISYYGGKKKQVEKSTRVRARVKAHALKQLLQGKEQVVVMGHKIGDVDSFGASIGIYRAARALNKRAYIVINELTTSVRAIKAEFENNSRYDSEMFLTESQALDIVNEDTALVIVDVNRPSMTECPSLLNRTKTIVVLDHHRQSSERIENAVLSYIEPFASSACEMVAEILQYITDGVKLKPAEANAMYAGLLIDTNNFSNKTGVRTFEAAAFIKRNGADIIKVRTLLRDDLATYKVRAKAVSTATIFDDCYAFAECNPAGLESPTIAGAQIANELLNITGVKASFVFTDIKGKIYISARSYDEINVQLVMERLGGGGHSTMAGAQLEGMSVDGAMAQVKMQLRIMKNEGDI